MTLEEHIQRYDSRAKSIRNAIVEKQESQEVVELLRELKAYREAEKEIEQELVNWNDIDNGKCRGLFLATSIIQYYKNEEVNADADSD